MLCETGNQHLLVPEFSNSKISKSPNPSPRSLSPLGHYIPQRENPTRKVVDDLLEIFLEEKFKCTLYNEITEILRDAIYDKNDNEYHIYQWLWDNQNTLKYKSLLGFFLLNGIGCDINQNKAFRLFMDAAKKNYLIGQEMISDCYLNGWGTTKNEELAFQWYKKCADNDSTYGYLALGFCYEDGKGIKKNEKEAFECFLTAARSENIWAMIQLVKRYSQGKGTNMNIEKANIWYKKAYDIGNDQIKNILNYLYNCDSI
ncbi:hypothetical protein Glove_94g25 [Diversispora epigaea]|uniref:HCP-like protein n=1 Tax=Diversispora epigaea TaxID=1348612 RepID=A0A397J9G7_9GLOM|nr:hypothetical protein Glove_94g25 [Diversispora epigaea]